jgi:hypothetical protein
MSKEVLICGFCLRECSPEQDVGYLKFPDGQKHPVHLFHEGVTVEYEKQMKKSV